MSMKNIPYINIGDKECTFHMWYGGLLLFHGKRGGEYYALDNQLNFTALWNNELLETIHPLNLPGIHQHKYVLDGTIVLDLFDKHNKFYRYNFNGDGWTLAS